MDYHHHAGYTIYCREQLAKSVIEGRLSLREAAAECRLSRQAAGKWVRRYREEGLAGLRDRSSRPHRCPRQTTQERIAQVESLRRLHWTGVRIAQELKLTKLPEPHDVADALAVALCHYFASGNSITGGSRSVTFTGVNRAALLGSDPDRLDTLDEET